MNSNNQFIVNSSTGQQVFEISNELPNILPVKASVTNALNGLYNAIETGNTDGLTVKRFATELLRESYKGMTKFGMVGVAAGLFLGVPAVATGGSALIVCGFVSMVLVSDRVQQLLGNATTAQDNIQETTTNTFGSTPDIELETSVYQSLDSTTDPTTDPVIVEGNYIDHLVITDSTGQTDIAVVAGKEIKLTATAYGDAETTFIVNTDSQNDYNWTVINGSGSVDTTGLFFADSAYTDGQSSVSAVLKKDPSKKCEVIINIGPAANFQADLGSRTVKTKTYNFIGSNGEINYQTIDVQLDLSGTASGPAGTKIEFYRHSLDDMSCGAWTLISNSQTIGCLRQNGEPSTTEIQIRQMARIAPYMSFNMIVNVQTVSSTTINFSDVSSSGSTTTNFSSNAELPPLSFF